MDKKKNAMTKRTLKIIIGLVYLLIVGGIYLIVSDWSQVKLPRLIVCFNWAFFGIVIRALIYYGLKRTGQDETLAKDEAVNTITSYTFYGFTACAIVSIIYLTFHQALKELDYINFNLIVIPLFSYVGFFTEEVKTHFLGKV